jgi:hypothetical protein
MRLGPFKNEYQDTPGGKDGRCVRLTTYHLQVPMSWNLEALEPSGMNRPVMGMLYLSQFILICCSLDGDCMHNQLYLELYSLWVQSLFVELPV